MNRRTAIACGIAAILGVGAGCARRMTILVAPGSLYDARFITALPDASREDIAERLASRGVLVGAARDMVDVDRVRARGASDALVEFERALYTETELLLYAFVARSHSSRRE